jgi:hypothetical protein
MVSKKSQPSFTAVIKKPDTTKTKKRKNSPPPRVENSSRRSREYLTPAEQKTSALEQKMHQNDTVFETNPLRSWHTATLFGSPSFAI